MSKTPDLETLFKPEEPQKPNVQDPEFLEFANAGMKIDPIPKKIVKREKARLCFHIDKDINDAIEKEIRSKRATISKTQWILRAILTKLRWKDKPPEET